MTQFTELEISRAILSSYASKLESHLNNDVIVVGAGPAGLVAASHLARRGLKVCVVEKRLAPGGGIWGGAMGMNVVAVQEEAIPILDENGVRHTRVSDTLHVVDAAELASSLCFTALLAGAALFNLMTIEDVSIRDGRVTGVVVNRTTISGALPVDPLTLVGRVVIDATGHDAAVIGHLRRRGLLSAPQKTQTLGEGPMNAMEGERFVVERAGEVYPGLWVCGMAVCATYNGPRMGPIFGGMLMSGLHVAEQIVAATNSEAEWGCAGRIIKSLGKGA